jgi:hypothetical protein
MKNNYFNNLKKKKNHYNMKREKVLIISSTDIQSMLMSRILSLILSFMNISFIINPTDLLTNNYSLEDSRRLRKVFIGFDKKHNIRNYKKIEIDNFYLLKINKVQRFFSFLLKSIVEIDSKKVVFRKKKEFSDKPINFSFFNSGYDKYFFISLKNLFLKQEQMIWIKSIILSNFWLSKKISYKNYIFRTKKLFIYYKKIRNICSFTSRIIKNGIYGKRLSSLNISDELPIIFYKHSSLFASISNTPYLSAKLKTWTLDGKMSVYHILYKIGFSGKDIKKPWASIGTVLKKTIVKLFEIEFNKFKIKTKKIFVFLKNYQSNYFLSDNDGKTISTFDWIFSARAIMDKNINNIGYFSSKSFWMAFDSLFNLKSVKIGIFLGKTINKFVHRAAALIVSKNLFVMEKNCFSVTITNSSKLTFKMTKSLAFCLLLSLNQDKLEKKFLTITIHRSDDTLIICCFFNKKEKYFLVDKLKNKIMNYQKIYENHGSNYLIVSFPLFQEKLFKSCISS